MNTGTTINIVSDKDYSRLSDVINLLEWKNVAPDKTNIFVACHSGITNLPLCSDMLTIISSDENITTNSCKVVYNSDDAFEKKFGVSYSEGSKIHYIWSHPDIIDGDYVGICHYRRFFEPLLCFDSKALNKIFTKTLGERKGIIVPHKMSFTKDSGDDVALTNRDVFNRDHLKEPMDVLVNVIKEYYPRYYKTTLEVLGEKDMFYLNMFIMKKDMFDKYCGFVFGALNRLNRAMEFSCDEDVQAYIDKMGAEGKIRIFNNEGDIKWQYRLHGFLMEYLTSIFIRKNYDTKSTYISNVIFTEENNSPDINVIEKPKKECFLKKLFRKIKEFFKKKKGC